MSTLKSPLSRGADAPHVHQRLRKHLARCTLDCGFKTPESPALRGFVAGLRALATAALYLAFFFVLEKAAKIAGNAVIPTFPAHCPHGLQHLRHKRSTFAFTPESGYTLGSEKDRTQGLTRRNRGVSDGGGITTSDRSARFGNPAWPGGRAANFAPLGFGSRVLPKNAKSLRDSDALMRVAVPRRRGPAGLRNLFLLLSELWLVHTRLSEKNRTQGHTRRNRWRFGWGRYHYPRHELHVHEHPRARCQNGVLCRFGILAGRCSRRTQKAFGTAMRLCVSLSRRRRGPAGLRDLFAIW